MVAHHDDDAWDPVAFCKDPDSPRIEKLYDSADCQQVVIYTLIQIAGVGLTDASHDRYTEPIRANVIEVEHVAPAEQTSDTFDVQS